MLGLLVRNTVFEGGVCLLADFFSGFFVGSSSGSGGSGGIDARHRERHIVVSMIVLCRRRLAFSGCGDGVEACFCLVYVSGTAICW